MDPILDARLAKLSRILEDLVRLNERLAEALGDKVQALAKMDRAQLADTLQTEEALLAQIGIVDGGRADLVSDVARSLGIPQGAGKPPVRLGALVQKIPAGPRKDSLGELRGRLENALTQVRRFTTQARALTEQSLAHVRLLLSALSGATLATPTYDRHARSNQGSPFAVLDRRA